MKLLMVTDTFPPDINGVARTLRTWAEALWQRGHEVEVVTTLAAKAPEPWERRVMASVPLPGYPGLRVGLASARSVREIIEAGGVDVLYVATETPLGIAAIRAAKRLGVPVVSGFHTNFQTYLEDYRLPGLAMVAERFLRSVHNRTARTLTPSEDTAGVLRAWGIENVGVVGRGVDTKLFDPAHRDVDLRKRWGAADGTPVALYVGRLAAEKNLPLAARVFRRMKASRPDLVGVFVGDGPRAKALQDEHPEFVFAGSREGLDLARHYASADVFVFPSLTETFGNVVLEAMASGLAVVGFDYAAPRLLIRDGVNGWLAGFGEEEAFAEQALKACAAWGEDGDLRARARQTALEHCWERVIDQFEGELLAAMPAAPAKLDPRSERFSLVS
jgi:glycosyltransferase involved in cell wall biosynthesis